MFINFLALQQGTVTSHTPLRIAIIGQSAFAVDVFHRLRQHGHIIVGVFTIPDKGKREDPLGEFIDLSAGQTVKHYQLLYLELCNRFMYFIAKVAQENDVPLFKIKAWRKAGKPLPDVLDTYKNVNADLNVLPYCSQFIPMEVINYPRMKTICYHPSLLPRHRGASSINW